MTKKRGGLRPAPLFLFYRGIFPYIRGTSPQHLSSTKRVCQCVSLGIPFLFFKHASSSYYTCKEPSIIPKSPPKRHTPPRQRLVFSRLLPDRKIFLPAFSDASIICCIRWIFEENDATIILFPSAFLPSTSS